MVWRRRFLCGAPMRSLRVSHSPDGAQGSRGRLQGGFQHSWRNRTPGNQLTAETPAKGCWPESRRPMVDNYQCGQGRQCRSALSQEIVSQAQNVTPFWKQNLGKGFLSIFGLLTPTKSLCHPPPPFSEASGLGLFCCSKRKQLRALLTMTFWLMATREGQFLP